LITGDLYDLLGARRSKPLTRGFGNSATYDWRFERS